MPRPLSVRRTSVGLSLLVLSIAIAEPALAQFDHLTCFKVSSSYKFAATATLDLLQNELDPSGECRILGKARLLCAPTDKQVSSFTVGGEPASMQAVPGPEPIPDRICYRVKCPVQSVAPLAVYDQFGAAVLSKFKAHLLCTPAVFGMPPTTTTVPPNNCTSEMIPGQGLACIGFCGGTCGCADGGTCFVNGGSCSVSSDCPPVALQCNTGTCDVTATSCTTNADCTIPDGCACGSTACGCF